MKSWFAVHTRPLAEAKAASHLDRQGFDVYLPRYRKMRRHARRLEPVVRPLFPRYLFVSFDVTTTRWRAIRSTLGVSDLVRSGDQPTPVADAIVTAIREREDDEGLVRLSRIAGLHVGQKLMILTGALSDQIGMLEGLSDKDRVTVLLHLMGRPIRLCLPVDAVGAVV
jgi:transcriptional antiterminator RfaH